MGKNEEMSNFCVDSIISVWLNRGEEIFLHHESSYSRISSHSLCCSQLVLLPVAAGAGTASYAEELGEGCAGGSVRRAGEGVHPEGQVRRSEAEAGGAERPPRVGCDVSLSGTGAFGIGSFFLSLFFSLLFFSKKYEKDANLSCHIEKIRLNRNLSILHRH